MLSRRVADYDPKWLDQLCLTGAVGWGRLSPHPATLESSGAPDGSAHRQRRVIPTSVAPITFFVREEADWMGLRQNPHFVVENATRAGRPSEQVSSGLDHGAQLVLEFLKQRGASFFADIVRGTGKLKSEIETALWELVAAGVVTADGFDNLRSLIDPKRRAGQGSGRSLRPRHSTGGGRCCTLLHARGRLRELPVVRDRADYAPPVPRYSRWILAGGVVYAVAIAAVGLWPTHIDRQLHLSTDWGYDVIEFAANVLWFAPLGPSFTLSGHAGPGCRSS